MGPDLTVEKFFFYSSDDSIRILQKKRREGARTGWWVGERARARSIVGTHRVALDWLFDRINFDSKIQIKYIDTKNQLADILTKGNFTRDEWTHLLCLFNISHVSSTNCLDVMSKRNAKKIQVKKESQQNRSRW